MIDQVKDQTERGLDNLLDDVRGRRWDNTDDRPRLPPAISDLDAMSRDASERSDAVVARSEAVNLTEAAAAPDASQPQAARQQQSAQPVHRPTANGLILHHVLINGLVLTAVVALAAFGAGPIQQALPMVVLCMLAGVLGAFFSFVLRAQTCDVTTTFRSRLVSTLVSISLGALGGMIVYLVFAAGLLEGGILPRFACAAEARCGTFDEFAWNWLPASAPDLAKAILWSFLGGFAERLSREGSSAARA